MGGYCSLDDLARYGLEGATNYYADATEGSAFIDQAYNWLNSRLEAILLDVSVPVATNSAGVYDQCLISMNANMANYYLARRRHGAEWNEEPEWIGMFRETAELTLEAIGSRHIVFEEQTAGVESGIGPVTAATHVGSAIFHSDRYGYNGPYTDSQYPRTFLVEIDSAGANADLSDSTYKWSADNGVTWNAVGVQCGTAWQELLYNAHIRWQRVGGTVNQVILGDQWTFTCTPLSKGVAGQPNSGRTVRMWRG